MFHAFLSTVRPRRAAAIMAVLSACAAQAAVQLHPLFSDHTVLQQGKPVPVWGWADPGEKVTVRFANQVEKTQADAHGRWMVRLGSMKATAASRVLEVSGSNTIRLQDVVVGEVWICSGQSNMEWPTRASRDPQADIQASANPLIRLFTVRKATSQLPLANFENPAGHSWSLAAPESVTSFSAVAYYFGRDLQKSLGVPVGLIHTSWGGSPAEAWTTTETLRTHPVYARDILESSGSILQSRKAALARWETERDAAVAAGKPAPGKPFAGWLPGDLYNAMIAPLLPYGIAGAIWYQGESNASRAWQYRSLFADMITDWRKAFSQGDFPFLAVQLAPWDKNKKRSLEEIAREPGDSDWAELREAQNYVADTLRKVGVAIITDVGDKDDIHPNQKQPVGARLALLAERIQYGKNVGAYGPVLNSQVISKGKVYLRFGQVGDGIIAAGGPLTGFAIAGADRKWHWAKAEIQSGGLVAVSSPYVKEPVAVRYGWSDFPIVNLTDSRGLPASPFRTDRWKITTQR